VVKPSRREGRWHLKGEDVPIPVTPAEAVAVEVSVYDTVAGMEGVCVKEEAEIVIVGSINTLADGAGDTVGITEGTSVVVAE
jgi:hypothetical protein